MEMILELSVHMVPALISVKVHVVAKVKRMLKASWGTYVVI